MTCLTPTAWQYKMRDGTYRLMYQEPREDQEAEPLYPASALKAAKVQVLREAGEKVRGKWNPDVELLRIAHELERSEG